MINQYTNTYHLIRAPPRVSLDASTTCWWWLEVATMALAAKLQRCTPSIARSVLRVVAGAGARTRLSPVLRHCAVRSVATTACRLAESSSSVGTDSEDGFDPYAWLEDPRDEDVRALIDRENEMATEALAETTKLQEALVKEMKDRMAAQSEDQLPDQYHGYEYFERTPVDQEHSMLCRRPLVEKSAEPEVLLDVNKLAAGTGYAEVELALYSHDGRAMVYMVCSHARCATVVLLKWSGGGLCAVCAPCMSATQLSLKSHRMARWTQRARSTWICTSRTCALAKVTKFLPTRTVPCLLTLPIRRACCKLPVLVPPVFVHDPTLAGVGISPEIRRPRLSRCGTVLWMQTFYQEPVTSCGRCVTPRATSPWSRLGTVVGQSCSASGPSAHSCTW